MPSVKITIRIFMHLAKPFQVIPANIYVRNVRRYAYRNMPCGLIKNGKWREWRVFERK